MPFSPKTAILLLTLSALTPLFGCRRGPARPDDLPALTPCVLTVTYQGAPLSDATVTLVPTRGKWVGVGQTGEDGQVTVRTNGRYDGVPAGSYMVTVTKQTEAAQLPPAPTTPEEDKAYSEALKSLPPPKQLVSEKYTKPETSGLTVTVAETPVRETLELTD